MAFDYQSRTNDFTSSSNPEIDNSSIVDETNINYFSAQYPFSFGNKNMVVSVNYQRLYDFKLSLTIVSIHIRPLDTR